MALPPQPPQVGESAPLQDWEEGTAESSLPPWSPRALYPDVHEVHKRIYECLRRTGQHDQALAGPSFHDRLGRHLRRLPPRYLAGHLADDKAEDVLLHWRILDECADEPAKRPVFSARCLKCITVLADHGGSETELGEPCQRLMEDLSLERRNAVDGNESMPISSRYFLYSCFLWQSPLGVTLKLSSFMRFFFCSLDEPKLLTRLATLLSEVGLNIREAHVYSTTDGFCLNIFVVDRWETEETNELIAKIKETLALKNASPSYSTNSSTLEKNT